jgi:flagellar hook-associated protein 2
VPTLSTQGIGSGLDIAGIVSRIMTIERQPWVKAGTKGVELQAQLSAYGQLKSVVSTFESTMSELAEATKFKASKATSSDSKVLTATADGTASRGIYAIEVKRLAENHRMVAGTVFADTNTTKVGTAGDTMVLSVGSRSFTVEIGDKTLDQIRTAINSATGNTGVTASTLRDASGYHLTLSGKSTGGDNFLSVAYRTLTDPTTPQPDRFNLTSVNTDRDASGVFDKDDLDAEIKVENTYTVKSSSNSVSDVIAGVSLELAGIGTSNLNVARDDGKIQSAVQQLVTAYNAIFKSTSDLKAKGLRDERGALLNIESQFRDALRTKAGSSNAFSYLAEIGLTTAANGAGLTLNTAIFQEALNKDPEGVASMFSDGATGAVGRFKKLAGTLVGAGGVLPGREESTRSRIDANTTARANLEFRLNRRETALNKQFNNLDALVNRLNSTSSYLTTQLKQFETNKNA